VIALMNDAAAVAAPHPHRLATCHRLSPPQARRKETVMHETDQTTYALAAESAGQTPPTRKGQETRQLIIERSSRLFEQQGFAATSLSQLVTSTGMTRGAFYFHFESKEALATAIVEAQVRRWPAMLAQVRQDEPDPLRGLLLLAFRAAFAVQSDPIVRAANRLLRERAQLHRRLPETFPWWTNTVEQFLGEAAAQGELKDLSHLVPPAYVLSHPDDAAAGRRGLAELMVAAWVGYQLAAGTDANRLADLLFTSWMTLIADFAARQERQDELCHLLAHLTQRLRTGASQD
jgi:AcrR family transcriptional regulator